MPSRNGVSPRRHVLESKAAVLASDLIIGVIEYGDIRLHPWVDVALHGNGNLGTREALHDRLSSRRLGFIPFAIVLGDGVDVVGGHVRIDDGQRLACLQGQNVRMILAALLVDHHRSGLRRERIRAEVALEVDDYILQCAAIAGNDVFCGCRRGMRLGAIGFGGHIDVLGLGGRAIELDGSGHGTGCGRIHGFARGISGWGCGFRLVSLPSTTDQRSSQCYGGGEVPQTFTHDVMTSSYKEFEGPSGAKSPVLFDPIVRPKGLTYKATFRHGLIPTKSGSLVVSSQKRKRRAMR